MSQEQQSLSAVPTNIITGFLGVGKTSAILNLLKKKPDNERWAVLVNEFGEIGVDGSLIQGQSSQKQGVYIKEVPGGCMCCASGLPMQIALNQLLSRAKPDRLLIEPTGLGHPIEILEVLSAEHYREALILQKTLTLVDARKLCDERYTKHGTFNQQISIADVIIGNKIDLYQDGDEARLARYIKTSKNKDTLLILASHGNIDLALLNGPTSSVLIAQPHHHGHESAQLLADAPLPETGFLKATNTGESYESIGWRFSPEKTFNHTALYSFLSGLSAERMKAVFITDHGTFGYNLTPDALTEVALDECMESRIEIIGQSLAADIETKLLACLNETKIEL